MKILKDFCLLLFCYFRNSKNKTLYVLVFIAPNIIAMYKWPLYFATAGTYLSFVQLWPSLIETVCKKSDKSSIETLPATCPPLYYRLNYSCTGQTMVSVKRILTKRNARDWRLWRFFIWSNRCRLGCWKLIFSLLLWWSRERKLQNDEK